MDIKSLIRKIVETEVLFSKKHPDTKLMYPSEDTKRVLPPTTLRENYGDDDELYMENAQKDYIAIKTFLKKHSIHLDNLNRMMDFGCATARLTFEFSKDFQKENLWGVDTNENHIIWNKNHLPNIAQYMLTTFFPYLPFEQHYFDLIIASSVFTHIDNLADAWIAELSRTLAPQKYLFLTINDERSLSLLLNDRKWADHKFAKFIQSIESEIDLVKFPNWCHHNAPQSHLHLFYDSKYFLDEVVSPFFNVVDTQRECIGFQTGVLLQKK